MPNYEYGDGVYMSAIGYMFGSDTVIPAFRQPTGEELTVILEILKGSYASVREMIADLVIAGFALRETDRLPYISIRTVESECLRIGEFAQSARPAHSYQ